MCMRVCVCVMGCCACQSCTAHVIDQACVYACMCVRHWVLRVQTLFGMHLGLIKAVCMRVSVYVSDCSVWMYVLCAQWVGGMGCVCIVGLCGCDCGCVCMHA